jgi:hypothetical protein
MSIALETARTQFAACASYQAFLGVDDPADAISRTYLAGLPFPSNEGEYAVSDWEGSLRPFVILYQSTHGGYSATRTALYAFRENGRMFAEFEISIPTTYQPDPSVPAVDLTQNPELSDRWIINQLGQIIADFMGLAGKSGYLDVSEVTVAMGPSRERNEEQPASGYYYWSLLEIVWGATE